MAEASKTTSRIWSPRSSPSRPSGRKGLLPACDIGIALVADEETGSRKGIDYVLEHTDAFRKQDLIIVPDAGNETGTLIEVAEKSILWLKIKTLGRQAHGSTPEKGINSFKAARLSDHGARQALSRRSAPETTCSTRPSRPSSRPKRKPTSRTSTPSRGRTSSTSTCRILPELRRRQAVEAEDPRRSSTGSRKKHRVKITIEEEQNAPAAASDPAPMPPVVRRLQAGRQGSLRKRGQGLGASAAARWPLLPAGRGYEAACLVEDRRNGRTSPTSTAVIDNLIGDAKVFAHIFLQE